MNNTRRSTRREVKVVSFSFLFLFFGLCTVVSVCLWLESAFSFRRNRKPSRRNETLLPAPGRRFGRDHYSYN